jgi:hypothetical protein
MHETPIDRLARESLAVSRRRSRRTGWIWFFAVLAVLAAVAIVIQVWYGNKSQLTREQLAQAEARWKAKGPADYDMDYTLRKLDSTENYRVKIRSRRAISVICNDQPLEERLFRYSEMPTLFGFIERFFELDAEPGRPRTFVIGTFDSTDGHLLHYVRSVMGHWEGRERQEITVTRFERVSGG